MNRQDSNRPLSLWLILLVLPILALAIYLQVNKTSPQISLKKDGAEAMPENAVAITDHPKLIVSADNKPRAATAPSESPLTAPTEPVGLDPESARAAVHKVENGVYERATQMFEREPVDVAWAGVHEQALRDMFSQHQGLQRVSINSISCHTSMCRIEVFTPRDVDADFFTAMFYDGLASFRDGTLKAEAAIARRMEQGMTSVYVARKDHTLGFY